MSAPPATTPPRWSWRRFPLGSLASGGFTVFVGLLMAVVLIQLQGFSPFPTLGSGAIYAFGDFTSLARTITWALPLYVAALGVAIAFRSGMFNIGAEGQIYAGAMAAALIGAYIGPMFSGLHLALAMAGSAVAGGLIAGGLGWLRAAWSVDEVLSTLLSNYLIVLFLAYLATGPLRDPTRQSGTTREVFSSAMFGEVISRTGMTSGVVVVIALGVLAWWLSEKSVIGYRWRMTGQSAPFAAAVGVNVNRARITSMVVSGAMCGIAGGLLVTASQGRFWTAIGGLLGWDAVLLALIGRARPLRTMVWVTIYAMMRSAARGIEQVSDVPSELSFVLISAIIIATMARGAIFSQIGVLVHRYTSYRKVEQWTG